jgi:GNAT superfamily N-acetyltransferase
VDIHIRPFGDPDYERMVEISTAIDPTTSLTADGYRYRDARLEPRVRLEGVAAEVAGAGMVGFGRVMHTWWNFHPHRYLMRLEVDPAWQRRGVGARLFDRVLEQLAAWQAELVRTETSAEREAAVTFLQRRGFREWHRRWDSVLEVATANVAPLLEADRRARQHGIVVSNFSAEQARRGERLAHDVYEMEALISRDEPMMEASGELMSFERFRATELDAPGALPEAHFLALAGDRLVGVSRLMRDLRHPEVLRVGFTGTDPEFRGRGIAQALKLRTIEYARQHGFREIRTGNDATNAPMLHINDRIGFKRESPVVIFERLLT